MSQNKRGISAMIAEATEALTNIQKKQIPGIVLMALALLANPRIIGHLFATSKGITSYSMILIIIFFEMVLFSIGDYLYKRPEEYKKVLAVTIMCLILWFPADYLATKAIKPPVYSYRQQDKILDHGLKPNGTGIFTSPSKEFTITYEINSLGLRSPEVEENKTKTRILVLGDSFTEGYGVNYTDTFSKKLNDYLGSKYEVINAGVSSYSPAPEYLYIKTRGIQLQPDIVILNLDNSDIQDDMTYTEHAKYDNRGELVSLGDHTTSLRESFSNTYTIINRLFYRDSDPKYFVKYHTLLNSCAEFEKTWNASFRYLNMTKHYLEGSNISFYVVIYPWGHQVATNQWTEGRKRFDFESDTIYPFAFADCFENHTYGEKFNVFNVLPDFVNESKNKKLYYDIDNHFNSAGHEAMAKGIYRNLVDRMQKNIGNSTKVP